MSDTATSLDRNVDLARVQIPLGCLLVITEAQIDRARILVSGFKADRIALVRDSWNTEQEDRVNLLFTLYDAHENGIISGLIEPDGRAHT